MDTSPNTKLIKPIFPYWHLHCIGSARSKSVGRRWVDKQTRAKYWLCTDGYMMRHLGYVAKSREFSISILLCYFLITSKLQLPLQLDIWLQSSEEFVDDKNNKKQKNLTTVFVNISKTIFPTSDSFLVIMSQYVVWFSASILLHE